VQYTESDHFTYVLGQQIPAIQDAPGNMGVIAVTQ